MKECWVKEIVNYFVSRNVSVSTSLPSLEEGKFPFFPLLVLLAGNKNDIRQINRRKPNYYVYMGNPHKYKELQRQQRKVRYIYILFWTKEKEVGV